MPNNAVNTEPAKYFIFKKTSRTGNAMVLQEFVISPHEKSSVRLNQKKSMMKTPA